MAALVLSCTLFASNLLHAHGPTRQKVAIEQPVAVSAAEAWALVGDFSAIHKWLPPVEKTEILSDNASEPGAVRRLSVGGGTIEEELKSRDDERMKLKYKITKGDTAILPVQNYSSIISVVEKDGNTIVKWSGAFYRGYMNNDPPPELNDQTAIDAVTALYKLGLENLKAVLEK